MFFVKLKKKNLLCEFNHFSDNYIYITKIISNLKFIKMEELIMKNEQSELFSPTKSKLKYGTHNSKEMQNFCKCHSDDVNWKSNKTREALIKLSIAAILAIIFTIAEAIGGYISSSLAILTDSAHMLSDFFGFIVSLISLVISKRKSSAKMHFGYHRAEVLGAIFSVTIIWIVTALLVYEAIQRVIHLDYEIDADVMLITATAGLYINVLLSLVLQIPLPKCLLEKDSHEIAKNTPKVENINIRAALIHCIGDIVQSVGVIIAGIIIRFRPDLKIADPICTFVFSILVTITTLNILRDAVHILMEGAPSNVKIEEVKVFLLNHPEVKQIHDLRIWSINSTRTCLSVHLSVDLLGKYDVLLESINSSLKERYSIDFTTIQIEGYDQGEYLKCPKCLSQND